MRRLIEQLRKRYRLYLCSQQIIDLTATLSELTDAQHEVGCQILATVQKLMAANELQKQLLAELEPSPPGTVFCADYDEAGNVTPLRPTVRQP